MRWDRETDRDLIQSVVEFSGKTVREAMKPRPEMVAFSTDATVEQVVELPPVKLVSRLPVYEGSIHNIKGILHAQDLLQVPDSEARTRTVASVMPKDAYFVPESKLGSDLLREMQKSNIRMAIVVDEYGGVAGLVRSKIWSKRLSARSATTTSGHNWCRRTITPTLCGEAWMWTGWTNFLGGVRRGMNRQRLRAW